MWPVLLSTLACAPRIPAGSTPEPTTEDTAPPTPVDADGDGWTAEDDCDDTNADVFPGAEESCNEMDDDCDRLVDEDSADWSTWYADADGDGFGDPNASITACFAPDGYIADGSDCDDTVETADGACVAEATIEADVVIDTTRMLSNAATLGADLDGDGRKELVTGVFYWSPGYDPDYVATLPPGEVQVFPGSRLEAGQVLTLADASLTLTGAVVESDGSGEVIGTSLAAVADLDGGGCDELLVGAYMGADGNGSVRLVPGERLTGAGNVAISDVARVEYVANERWVGANLFSQDFDGDGRGDLLMDGGGDTTSLVWGADPGEGTVLLDEVATSLPPGEMGAPGDIDGDGLDDLLLHAYSLTDPRVSVYLGGTLRGADTILEEDADFELLLEDAADGDILQDGRDVDGDGLPDLLVGDYSDRTTSLLFATSVLASHETSLADADIRIVGSAWAARPVHVDAPGVARLRVEWGDNAWTCSIPVVALGGTYDESDCFDSFRLDDYDIRAWSTGGDVTGDGTGELLLSATDQAGSWTGAGLYLLFDQY